MHNDEEHGDERRPELAHTQSDSAEVTADDTYLDSSVVSCLRHWALGLSSTMPIFCWRPRLLQPDSTFDVQ